MMSLDYRTLFIGGEWRNPAGTSRLEVHSPATEQLVGSAPLCEESDVDAAVDSAKRALADPSWRDLSPAERAKFLEALADRLEETSDERAALTSSQNGMPITLATLAEGAGPVQLLRYYAGLALGMVTEEVRPRLDGLGDTLVRREPIGVVAMIVPWNFPQGLTMFKLAPALAAGCTVVLKPAPETTLDAFMLAEAAERAGLPAGVLNVVTGSSRIGEYLVTHPHVHKVAFTGSTEVGRRIGESCGRLLRPFTLELGGKSAAIILDDADVASTVEGLAMTSLLNAGQTCNLSTRILVPRTRHDDILEAIAQMAAALPVGDPLRPETFVGPLVSERQRLKVEGYIAVGKESGATLATGGERVTSHGTGYFIQPTVFGNVDNHSPIAREEIFGPVLAVIPYEDIDQAVAIANDSDYGLGGTVWTTDVDAGLNIARQVETGTIGVNFYNLDFGAPFGGVKSSGIGRELGPEGLSAYFQLKSIFLPPAAASESQ